VRRRNCSRCGRIWCGWEEGEKLLTDGVEAWKNALAWWDTPAVLDFYSRREKDYLPYSNEVLGAGDCRLVAGAIR